MVAVAFALLLESIWKNPTEWEEMGQAVRAQPESLLSDGGLGKLC